jgi:hypothetical protein
MKSIRLGPWPASADLWRWILMGAMVLVAGLNLPGHLSHDSILSLEEGRTGVRVGWGPPMYSAILGVFDKVIPGTGLFVAASLLLLLGAWGALPALRPRITRFAPVVLLAAVSLPQVILYQGIVWKDVLFANLAIAAFIALGRASVRWESQGAAWSLAFAWVCLAVAALVRQNGLLAIVFAAAALGWLGWRGGWRKGLAWGAAGLAVPLAIAALLNAVTPVREPPGVPKKDVGVRLVQHYDIVHAVAQDPRRPMPVLEAADARRMRIIRRDSPRIFSPSRVDTLDLAPRLGPALWDYTPEQISAQWRQLILEDPLGYLGRRLSIFNWVLRTPQIDQCLPVHVGVAGPEAAMRTLQLQPGIEPQDSQLANYASWWLDTPAFSHFVWALIAVAVSAYLLVRREGADVAMAGLLLSGLAFAGSFLIISLACDYRYLYFLDMAAITGVLYLAVDPSRRPR